MAEEIAWSNDLMTGNFIIDTQHRLMFTVANRMTEDVKTTDIEAIMGEMVHYAETHFKEEERLMASVKYPQMVKHRQLHQRFMEKLEEVKEKIDPGTVSSVVRMRNLILEWWRDHILNEDQEFIQFYKDASN